MNTEPPQGDDLQQMLVTMKHNVLARAELDRPAPGRRGHRAGIVIGIIAVLGIGVGSGAVALGMVPQPFTAAPAPSPTVTEPTQTPTKSSAPVVNEPTTTPTPAQADGVIPSDCRALVPADDYDRFFGTIPLQDPAGSEWGDDTGFPAPDLWCIWKDPRADVTGLDIKVGKSTAENVHADTTLLEQDGWVCSTHDGGRFCQRTQQAVPYPVDTTTTFFIKGTTWVEINQTNVATNGLLQAVQEQVWG
ncbi:hypothetical protein AAEP80_17935 [Curtobacterium sp. L3-7]|uniref:hypothetical protein n=1 Tax=Curtobacterium sp. L3-7 TaxID=3138787 RepID=UPI003B51EA99